MSQIEYFFHIFSVITLIIPLDMEGIHVGIKTSRYEGILFPYKTSPIVTKIIFGCG